MRKLDLNNNPYRVEIDYKEREFYLYDENKLEWIGQFDGDYEIYEHSVFDEGWNTQVKLTEEQFIELSQLLFKHKPEDTYVETRI